MYNDIDNYLWRSLFMSKNCAKAKPKIMSHITFNKLFFNNEDTCRNFFLNIFHPLGLVCPECGCVHFTLLKCRNNLSVHIKSIFLQELSFRTTNYHYIHFFMVYSFLSLLKRGFLQKNCHVSWASTEKVLSCYAKKYVI